MPLNTSDTKVYRRDVATSGQVLSVEERAKLIEQYLPKPSTISSTPERLPQKPAGRRRLHKQRIRPFLRSKFHFLIYFLIQLFFGIFIRFTTIYSAVCGRIIAILHYHHQTPEYIQRDVKDLSRLPEHLSVILKYRAHEEGGLETLVDEVAELCAWSAAAGIPLLSVYEKSGILKSYIPTVQQLVKQKLAAYFGPAPNTPKLRVFAPNHNSSNSSPLPSPRLSTLEKTTSNDTNPNSNGQTPPRIQIDLLLLSATDGRDTLVDLTRTLTEMAQSNKIRPKDITSDLINTEISATTAIPNGTNGFPRKTPSPSTTLQPPPSSTSPPKVVAPGEPDLVIVFGPLVKLDGYPPWQIRLSEIFCVGSNNNSIRSGGDGSIDGGLGGWATTRVEYQGFLRALWKFAGAEMRFGR